MSDDDEDRLEPLRGSGTGHGPAQGLAQGLAQGQWQGLAPRQGQAQGLGLGPVQGLGLVPALGQEQRLGLGPAEERVDEEGCVSLPYQHTISIHHINTPNQPTLSPFQPTPIPTNGMKTRPFSSPPKTPYHNTIEHLYQRHINTP